MEKERYMICNSAEDVATICIDLNKDEALLLNNIFDKLNNNKNRYAPTISICKI